MSELLSIPNVGKRTEADLIAMGYPSIASLKGVSAERLYEEECALRGEVLDRCQLYLLRAVVYFVNTEAPDPAKCPWWFWKDEFISPSPCGAVCAECALFPKSCGGCRTIEGRVHWLQYTGAERCPVYACCVGEKGLQTCGPCEMLPCERFTRDPTVSDAENEAHLREMVGRLRK